MRKYRDGERGSAGPERFVSLRTSVSISRFYDMMLRVCLIQGSRRLNRWFKKPELVYRCPSPSDLPALSPFGLDRKLRSVR